MLFNSFTFIGLYLPITLGVFFLLGRRSADWAVAWMAAASLAFYGWWDIAYVPLLLGSIAYNYMAGLALARTRSGWLLAGAIAGDLALLGWFKYAGFFVSSAAALTGADWSLPAIVLPLGISFFTFTQIAFLVDCWKGQVREAHPLRYVLFVTYFPHLIAGPVLHHKEMMPQFAQPSIFRPQARHLAVGLTIFVIGLFKKVVLADGIAPVADAAFGAASSGEVLPVATAWTGALAYSLQLYFDFSGYSDMAVGLARMMGVRLPLNFHSPYKATSIIEFWRRWHITLSRFLRDYLYIPLGGNQKGPALRYVNLGVTMVLGGLWHGAGWTFVVWGALHGAYLMVNHAWRHLRGPGPAAWPERLAGQALTFLAVVVAWVFFRADSLDTALSVLRSMAFLDAPLRPDGKVEGVNTILGLLAIAFLAPNSQEIMARFRAGNHPFRVKVRPPRWGWLAWRPTPVWTIATALLALVAAFNLTRVSTFLYFQF